MDNPIIQFIIVALSMAFALVFFYVLLWAISSFFSAFRRWTRNTICSRSAQVILGVSIVVLLLAAILQILEFLK